MDKKNKNPNVPNLRFPLYQNKWECKKIKDILKICHGRDYKHLESGKYPVLGTSGIFAYVNQYLCDWPCALIGRKGASLDKPHYMDSPFWCVDTLYYSKPIKNNNPKWQYYLFQTINWMKMNESSGIPSLRASTIENIDVFVPSYQEQTKIVEFLNTIDQRIQTQIKIIDDLLSYRNSIIDDFFKSKSDSKKIKLKEILEEHVEFHVKDNSVVHATLSKEGIYPKTERYDRDFLVKNNRKKYKVSYLDDICYNPANLKFGVITRNTYGKCIISPIYVTFKIKNGYIPKFIELLVTRKQFIKEARKYEQGTVYERMAVNVNDLLSLSVPIPSSSIQQKFINIINSIDSKITNEKELLKLFQNQKNYLLKNMFV